MPKTILKQLPRERRIPPRGEAWIRYVNDTILANVANGEDDTTLSLPPLVERAFMLLNETAPLTVAEYPVDTAFRRIR